MENNNNITADLTWDSYGKNSIIVFGNIEVHANYLEIMGGKLINAKYSPLANGRKWTEKMGRTRAYYFSATNKAAAIHYLTDYNRAIFDLALWHEGEEQKNITDYTPGQKVVTIWGLGEVTEHPAQYSSRCLVVKLDTPTYNYGWKGLPQTFVEVSCENMRPVTSQKISLEFGEYIPLPF
ncbi:hypothetical protein IKF15_02315 [Candidatus Saccharibacteria bacterium]|nr:hypothetical protein [Candidatus Saccharibacteria bacterium]